MSNVALLNEYKRQLRTLQANRSELLSIVQNKNTEINNKRSALDEIRSTKNSIENSLQTSASAFSRHASEYSNTKSLNSVCSYLARQISSNGSIQTGSLSETIRQANNEIISTEDEIRRYNSQIAETESKINWYNREISRLEIEVQNE